MKEVRAMKDFTTIDGKNKLTRLSRWITIRQNYNTSPRNGLYYYVTDGSGYHPHEDNFDPENGTFLDYFHFNGRTYAIEQFVALGSTWIGGEPYRFKDTDGTITTVSAVDFDGCLYDPIYIELDEYGERVRVYELVGNK